MKPAGEASQRARLLVVGHGVSLGFVAVALLLTAQGIQIIYGETLGDEWEMLPKFGHLILCVAAYLRTHWYWLVFVVAGALWLDWQLILHLLRRPSAFVARLWAHCVFGLMLVFTTMCVGLFRFWMWQLFQPFGSVG